MKYIKKKREPSSLQRWKRQTPHYKDQPWDVLPSKVKDDIRKSLLNEQGHICCYCGMRISDKDSSIEHLKPQARNKYPALKFDYKNNLLASCNGGATHRKKHREKNLHCDPRKHDWFVVNLMVSPLDQFCEEYFSFTTNGEILPSTDRGKTIKATTTINKLGLDVSRLNKHRREAINGFFIEFDELEIMAPSEAKKTVQQLIRGLKKRDSESKFTPFCIAVISVLKQYL